MALSSRKRILHLSSRPISVTSAVRGETRPSSGPFITSRQTGVFSAVITVSSSNSRMESSIISSSRLLKPQLTVLHQDPNDIPALELTGMQTERQRFSNDAVHGPLEM